jgi:hypothetical protein
LDAGESRAERRWRLRQGGVETVQPRVPPGQPPQHRGGVAQSGEDRGHEEEASRKLAETRAQRQEVAREIAAVHARDVARKQRLERARVIPIIEMPAVPFEALHRGEGILGPLDQQADREIAEVAGGEVREQRQPHVGGRRARGHDRTGHFLEVVGGQPVFLGRDEGFKEPPGLAGGLAEEGQLFRLQPGDRRLDGLADPPGDPRCNAPQGEDRRCQRQRPGLHHRQVAPAPQRDGRGDPHGPVEPGEVGARGAFGITGGLPF